MPVILFVALLLISYVTVPLALVALLTACVRPHRVRAWYATAIDWLILPLRALLIVMSFDIYERLIGPWLGALLALLGVHPFGPFVAALAAWFIGESPTARGFAGLGSLALVLKYGASWLRRSATRTPADRPDRSESMHV